MIIKKGRVCFEARGTRICLSQSFGLSLSKQGARKRAPRKRLSAQARRQAERIQALSKTQQRFVARIIGLLELATRSSASRS